MKAALPQKRPGAEGIGGSERMIVETIPNYLCDEYGKRKKRCD